MTTRVRLLLLTIALILLAWSLTAPEPPREAANVLPFKQRKHIA